MTNTDNTPAGSILCQACGLCCRGCFYTYSTLHSDKNPSSSTLASHVVKKSGNPDVYFIPQQPCPFWDGMCSIYNNPIKSGTCGNYRCKLLKEVQNGDISLDQALSYVEKTNRLITELEGIIPVKKNGSFLNKTNIQIPQLEGKASHGDPETDALLLKIGILLTYFSRYFGVMDIYNQQMNSEKPLEEGEKTS